MFRVRDRFRNRVYVVHLTVAQLVCCSGGSKNFEKGAGGGRQFISSVLIYRKCAQRNICLLHGKKRFFEKIVANKVGGRLQPPHHLESATLLPRWLTAAGVS